MVSPIVEEDYYDNPDGSMIWGPLAFPPLSGGEAYRRIHSIAGIGKAVGFSATGRAARAVENTLLPAHSAGRGLKAAEVAALTKQLQLLRAAAQHELDIAAASGM